MERVQIVPCWISHPPIFMNSLGKRLMKKTIHWENTADPRKTNNIGNIWTNTNIISLKEVFTCMHRRITSGRQHRRHRPCTIYAAGSFSEPSSFEYKASKRKTSKVTPAWKPRSSPTAYKSHTCSITFFFC